MALNAQTDSAPSHPDTSSHTAAMPETSAGLAKQLKRLRNSIHQVILGKDQQVQLALACLLAKGHLLIEDLPGMGKTTLAHTLAKVTGLDFRRIQFTSDLLPADISGAAVFDSRTQQFSFQPGPVFCQCLLADEINRATPKAQSALLEAMEEQQVSVDGISHSLPVPFFVIATQNPLSQMGTFPLPESQLDRFLMRIELGYPDPAAERAMLTGAEPRTKIDQLAAVLDPAGLEALQRKVEEVHLSEPLLDYLQRLVTFSRQNSDFDYGLSPRAAMGLVRCTRAWALLEGRDYAIPEDLQQIFPAVVEHRLQGSHDQGSQRGQSMARKLLEAVDVLD